MSTSIRFQYFDWSSSTSTENSFIDLQSLLIKLMWNVTHSLVGRFYFITKRYSLLARLLIIEKKKSETTHLLTFVNDPNWHIMCLKPTIISIHRRDFLFLLCSPMHPTFTCMCACVCDERFICLSLMADERKRNWCFCWFSHLYVRFRFFLFGLDGYAYMKKKKKKKRIFI